MRPGAAELPGGEPGMVRAKILEAVPGLLHAFSTRHGGVSRGPFASLNLGATVGDDPDAVGENRRRLLGSLGLRPEQVVRARQVHGGEVLVVDEPVASRPDFPQGLLDGEGGYDGLVTDLPGLALAISTADCTPILIWDPVRRGVGAVHAGWPSTARRIGVKALAAMQSAFGTDPADCRVAIGPAIRGCCYEVDEPVARAMAGALAGWEAHAAPTRPGHWRLDLAGVNRTLLEAAGVPGAQIEDLGLCTACRTDLFFSHRAEKGKTGRMLSVIMRRAEDGAGKRET